MSWTNEIVLEFLELYRKEQHLWDPKHPLHRNRCEVSEAWARIQSSLRIPSSIIDLKKKKESLMTSFRMHLSKKKNQDGYRTTWFAYPLMESFLGGKYECDSTSTIQLDYEFFQPDLPDGNNYPENNKEVTAPIKQKRTSTHKCSNSNASEVVFVKKRMDEAVTYMKNANDEKNEMDEYDLYGTLLAKKLRKLDEHQRDLAMHEIDNIMFRAKMNSQPSQARSSSSPPGIRKAKSPIFLVTHQNTSNNAVHYEDENATFKEHHTLP